MPRDATESAEPCHRLIRIKDRACRSLFAPAQPARPFVRALVRAIVRHTAESKEETRREADDHDLPGGCDRRGGHRGAIQTGVRSRVPDQGRRHLPHALVANTASTVPLAPNAKITLNGKVVTLGAAFWDSADRTIYRFDIVNERLGDTGTEAVVQNADGSKTMYMVRLKVANRRDRRGRDDQSESGRGRPAVGARQPQGSVAGAEAHHA